jgi:hypothetical protein
MVARDLKLWYSENGVPGINEARLYMGERELMMNKNTSRM